LLPSHNLFAVMRLPSVKYIISSIKLFQKPNSKKLLKVSHDVFTIFI